MTFEVNCNVAPSEMLQGSGFWIFSQLLLNMYMTFFCYICVHF